jgi:hypothetical protein
MKFTVTYKSKNAKAGGNSYKGQLEAPSAEKAWELVGSQRCKFGYRAITIEPATTKKGKKP